MKSKQAGFTLMELMITVAVIALLASIVYPSYRDGILKSHRATGRAAIMQQAQVMERCFTRTNTFVGCITFPVAVEGGRYQITNGGTAPTATTYTLAAVPQGAQTADARCGTLTLQQDNTRTESGTATVADCW
jgi:type IV pilus assembly protein PilE